MARARPGRLRARLPPPRLNPERAAALELRRESRHRAKMDFALAIDHVQIAMPVGAEAQVRVFFGVLLGLAELSKPSNIAARGGCWFALGARIIQLGEESGFQYATMAHGVCTAKASHVSSSYIGSYGLI